MRIIRYLKKLLKRVIYESKEMLIFQYDREKQGNGKTDPSVIEYNNYRDIDIPFRKKLLPFPFINPLFYRFRRHNSRLFVIIKNTELCTYGWIQNCASLYKKNYSSFVKNGLLLGPYWTNPAYRGQGLYGRMLHHSLAVIDKNRPIVICTRVENHASISGIKKAGFRYMGSYSVLSILYFYVKHSKIKIA